ncbi:hypothetical protein [Methylobacterium nigriterrae]|uniref:hypothetical protein n=1 Tax=Methylobacterium nigriterrae TaxID=3127512 RepID=UPI00301358C7
MDQIRDSLPDPTLNKRWAQAARQRRALFVARDALSAEILKGSETGIATGDAAAPVSPGAPTLVFALEKPTRPRSWRARRSHAATDRRRRRLFEASGLFDAAWYRARYPDVETAGMDALEHFLDHGSFEGRSPGPDFDAIAYLARYPDVVSEKMEPWLHYVLHGKAEGRATK